MESLEEAKRNGKKDIPPMGVIKKVIYACEWGTAFNYPLEKIKAADYHVEYEQIATLGSIWLIEASTRHLHKEIIQLERSAHFFNENKHNIDAYLIVLDTLSRPSKQKYSLKQAPNKPLKIVYEKHGPNNKEYKILGKPLFFVYREDFPKFKK